MQALIDSLKTEYGLTPVMAAEIECYVLLPDDSVETMNAFWAPINQALGDAGVALLRIEKERGDHQYEIITQVTTPQRLAEWLDLIKKTIAEHAKKNDLRVTFDAKPFDDQPSSGLHLHIHLADSEGINAYHKTPEWISDALRWSLGGLLADMTRALPIFCPGPHSKYRFDDTDHVPKICGWGVNNRYCALRIPMNEDPYDKRIEHRVPGADADSTKAIEAVLQGVLTGLRNKIEPPEQEYGKPTIGFLASLPLAAGGEGTDQLAHGG